MVEPQTLTEPARSYQSQALGEITVTQEEWQYLEPFFRTGFDQRLAKGDLGIAGVEAQPSSPESGVLFVTGTLTEIDEGSAAARFIIGFGAGRVRLRGDFTVLDATGVQLASFTAGKAYSGGAGVGGLDLVSMNELMADYGAEIAERVANWARGRGPVIEESGG